MFECEKFDLHLRFFSAITLQKGIAVAADFIHKAMKAKY
jgi:hypothetical protein